jgi:CPA2 family monovalent cation:H+ antiporter-2
MHQIEILKDLVIIFGLAGLVVFLFSKFKLPSVVGFLMTGIIAGPYGLALIQNSESTEVMAEIGVILLLFTIGIEFSIKKLIKIRNLVFLGGGLQVLLTIFLVFLMLYAFKIPTNIAVFVGFLVALSSTAIILKLIQSNGQIDTHHGKLVLGILILQDLVIVPMMLLVPMLSGQSTDLTYDLLAMGLKSLILVGFTFVMARWVVPFVLHQIALSKSQELFLMAIILIGFAVANLSAMLGLSLALGAFLAGLSISESEYSHHAFGNLVPFRDIFSSFFFISIGMLLNVSFFLEHWPIIIIASIILILLKIFAVSLTGFVLGFPFKISFQAGLILAQIGEFSFVLAQIGQSNQLIDGYYYQLFLAVAVLSMSVTPVLILLQQKITHIAERLPLPIKVKNGFRALPKPNFKSTSKHVILVGSQKQVDGLMKAFDLVHIPSLVIDTDADKVRSWHKKGRLAMYGNAKFASVLQHAYIEHAQVMILAIAYTPGLIAVMETAKRLNPNVYLVVRTNQVDEMEALYKMGADFVIPTEFETSIEMFSKALGRYLVTSDEIDKVVSQMRSQGYQALRTKENRKSTDLDIPDFEIHAIKVSNRNIHNQSLLDLNLRQVSGVSILAIKRGAELISNPSAKELIQIGDIVYLLGYIKQEVCIFSE